MSMNDRRSMFPIRKGQDASSRICMILWGLYNVGKTTWAATAPGDKLWLSFGDNEHIVVQNRPDVQFIEMFKKTKDEIFNHGIGPNPYGLDEYLYENKNIKTVVVDSLTEIAQAGLEKAVADGVGKSSNFSPTMQAPGRPAYGGRNQNLLMLMKSLMMVTAKHGVHIIFTAHENDPVVKSDGRGNDSIEVINMSLGGQLINLVSNKISEVWNLRQEPGGKRNRIITVRVSGYRRPLKSRMFNPKSSASFVLNYDPDKPDNAPGQMTIAGFHREWSKSGKASINTPDNRKGGDSSDNNPSPTKSS